MHLFNDVREKVMALAADNASTLLTAGGVVGTVATAVLAGRASIKAHQVVEQAKARKGVEFFKNVSDDEDVELGEPVDDLSKLEKFTLVAPHFVPPVITGAATIAAIIMANRMSAQKVAALAAAYGMTQKHFEEYKTKVSEKLTGPQQTKIDDELAQERVSRTSGHDTVIVGDGEVLCFDAPTGRYFRATMENIKQAVNSTNSEIIHHDYASASYFYEEIGLPPTSWTDMVGWNTDQLLELKYSTVMDPTNTKPCISIDFKVLPKLDYVPKHY